mmetsp:Transcript_78335/g.221523  ORF Transcript_78335/g.221523 Transcript_78335/m.221523 type:complete len:314 (-) Transcript_78335:18-959(-)
MSSGIAPKPGGRRCGTPSSDSTSSSRSEGARSGGGSAPKFAGGSRTGSPSASARSSTLQAMRGRDLASARGTGSGAIFWTTRKSSWPTSLGGKMLVSPAGRSVRSESSSLELRSGSVPAAAGALGASGLSTGGPANAPKLAAKEAGPSLGRWLFRASTMRAVMSSSADAGAPPCSWGAGCWGAKGARWLSDCPSWYARPSPGAGPVPALPGGRPPGGSGCQAAAPRCAGWPLVGWSLPGKPLQVSSRRRFASLSALLCAALLGSVACDPHASSHGPSMPGPHGAAPGSGSSSRGRAAAIGVVARHQPLTAARA